MRNFVIVGVQRIGSSALAESIGLNPMVACGWEWTREVPWRNKLKAAEQALNGDFVLLPQKHRHHMEKVLKPDKSWLGFRRLFRASDKWLVHPRFAPALWMDRLDDHIRWFSCRPDIHIIHIVRRQSVDWLKSVYVARKTGLYSGKPYPQETKVEIPPSGAVARLQTKDWVDHSLARLDHSNPYLQVNYEDFLQDRNAVTERALDFLECDTKTMQVEKRRVHKQSRGGAGDYVLNYDELCMRLEGLDMMTPRFDRLEGGNI